MSQSWVAALSGTTSSTRARADTRQDRVDRASVCSRCLGSSAVEVLVLLEIELEGVRYGWTGRVWVDRRRIRVPAVLASTLSRYVADDGLVLPPIPNEDHPCWDKRGSDRRGVLDYELSHDNHLRISVHLSKAWRKYQHGWGAIMQGRISLDGVKSMLVRFKAFSTRAQPGPLIATQCRNLHAAPPRPWSRIKFEWMFPCWTCRESDSIQSWTAMRLVARISYPLWPA
jgi:hypothetical protein